MKLTTHMKNLFWASSAILLLCMVLLFETPNKTSDAPAMLLIQQEGIQDYALFGRKPITEKSIMKIISDPNLTALLRKECGWQASQEDIMKRIEIKKRLSGQNNYLLTVNADTPARSKLAAKCIGAYLLAEYRSMLPENGREKLEVYRAETQKLRQSLEKKQEMLSHPEKIEILDQNVSFYNRQLEYNEDRLIGLYTSFLGQYDKTHTDLKVQLDMALQEFTEEELEVKLLRLKLQSVENQRRELAASFENYPLYLNDDGVKLSAKLPAGIHWLMKNIGELRRKKNTLLLKEEIKNLETDLEERMKNEEKMERLFAGSYCDLTIIPLAESGLKE